MDTTRLPPDFKEFLRLLKAHEVEYLLIGGYAVGFYGFPRATVDMDIWVARNQANAPRIVAALREFGFATAQLSPELFLREHELVRMGVPPFRLEVLTTISGVTFAECYAARTQAVIDEVEVDIISAADLKINKRASGRHKDLNDLENLP